jgi:hypothetical protein
MAMQNNHFFLNELPERVKRLLVWTILSNMASAAVVLPLRMSGDDLELILILAHIADISHVTD